MITVHVPATSANCCVGFDSLGMAIDWWATFRFEPSDTLKITGCPEEYADKNNLVVQAFQTTCQYLDQEMPTFHLDIDSDIPFSRGLGSSSTCVVAGILACDAWFEAQMNKMEILKIATQIEGHPDNVAPCIFGQAVTSFMDQGQPRMMIVPCASYHGLAMIPDYPIVTNEARKILPQSLPYQEAVSQVGHALCFIQALQVGNEMILARACQDFLHEPYRKKLIPDYDPIHSICQELDLAMWISGSGSTMLALSMDLQRLEKLKQTVENESPHILCRRVRVASKGAWVENE